MEKYNKIQVRQEIESFQTADNYKTKKQIGSVAERLKTLIGSVEVVCPFCETLQRTESFESRKCTRCGRTFQLFPKNDFSNLAHTEWNMKRLHNIHQLHSIMSRGRFICVM